MDHESSEVNRRYREGDAPRGERVLGSSSPSATADAAVLWARTFEWHPADMSAGTSDDLCFLECEPGEMVGNVLGKWVQEVLRDPERVRELIVLAEVLRRPEERWV
jgi:hypothetical protein